MGAIQFCIQAGHLTGRSGKQHLNPFPDQIGGLADRIRAQALQVFGAPQVRKALAERDIFVQTNWSYLLTDAPEDSLDRRWSADILPLPVDQRYGEQEMRAIADAVRELTGR